MKKLSIIVNNMKSFYVHIVIKLTVIIKILFKIVNKDISGVFIENLELYKEKNKNFYFQLENEEKIYL